MKVPLKGIVVRCVGDGCDTVLNVPLPIEADQLALSIIGSGWCAVGRLSSVGYIHPYCWRCAERELEREFLMESQRVAKQIEAIREKTRRGKVMS